MGPHAEMVGARSASLAVWAGLVLLSLGTEGLPLMDVAPVQLNQQGLGETADALACHEISDAAEKAMCCDKGLKGWRSKQVLYKDLEDARIKKLTAAEETAPLKAAFERAKAAWESSQSKLTFEQGFRECANSKSAYKLPKASAATAAREAADANFKNKEAEVAKAKKQAEQALEKQADKMAEYTKMAGSMDSAAAAAHAAATKAQQAKL